MRPLSIIAFAALLAGWNLSAQKPLRLGVAGVTHDHLAGVVQMLGSKEIEVVGVYESDPRYLKAVVRGEVHVLPTDLSALDNNLIVMEILDAAIRSDRQGKAVRIR